MQQPSPGPSVPVRRRRGRKLAQLGDEWKRAEVMRVFEGDLQTIERQTMEHPSPSDDPGPSLPVKNKQELESRRRMLRELDAGFYYTGFDDQVRGFRCSITLWDWKSGDEPFVKHRRRKHQPQKSVDSTETATEKDKKLVLQKKAEEWIKSRILTQATPFIQRATNRKSYESKKYMVEDIYQVEEDANMDSNRMETTSSVPDNLKWIFNPSLHGISSAVRPAPSYLTDVLCYTSGQLSDTHNPLSMDLLQKLDAMSPQEYSAAIRNDLPTNQVDWLMSVETRRRKTFLDNWPHAGNLSGERMAQAGFYHSDGYDSVRCVFCGVVIDKWETEDNPIAEHTRWVPLCWFVQSLKCEMASSHDPEDVSGTM